MLVYQFNHPPDMNPGRDSTIIDIKTFYKLKFKWLAYDFPNSCLTYFGVPQESTFCVL
jgi:hypothetical protein